MNNNEDIGYLKRAVEELTKLIVAHMKKEEEDRAAAMTKLEKMDNRIKDIEVELSNARAIGKVLRFVAGLLLIVLTFKLGDLGRFL